MRDLNECLSWDLCFIVSNVSVCVFLAYACACVSVSVCVHALWGGVPVALIDVSTPVCGFC